MDTQYTEYVFINNILTSFSVRIFYYRKTILYTKHNSAWKG